MATWIVHLRVAQRLIDLREDLDPACVAVGSVAPDSGIPDEDWKTFDPPAQVTHFQVPEPAPWLCADLAFYREHVVPALDPPVDRQRVSFLLGYFSHLVVDNLWHVEITLPTKSQYVEQFAEDPEFIWEIKRDWYGLDLEYVRVHPDSLFWRAFVPAAPSDTCLDFLPLEAVNQRLNYIKTFYQRTDDEIEERMMRRERVYLTQEQMDRFVSGASDRFERILSALSSGSRSIPSDLDSALDV